MLCMRALPAQAMNPPSRPISAKEKGKHVSPRFCPIHPIGFETVDQFHFYQGHFKIH